MSSDEYSLLYTPYVEQCNIEGIIPIPYEQWVTEYLLNIIY
jgi:hypothetical protein